MIRRMVTAISRRDLRSLADLDPDWLAQQETAIRWHYADQGYTVTAIRWAVDDMNEWAASLLDEDTDAETVLIATVQTVRTRAEP